MEYTEEIKLLKSLHKELQKIVLNDFRNLDRVKKEMKDGYSPVTETDIEVNNLIIKSIKDRFPNDQILSEEIEGQSIDFNKRVWIIDPICGTRNFSKGIFFFVTNICLYYKGKVQLAFVVDYSNNTYILASEDLDGVYVGENRVKNKFILNNNSILNFNFGYLFNNNDKSSLKKISQILGDLVLNYFKIVEYGSSLTISYTALAKFGAFVITETRPWDVVCGSYFIEKNGGIVTDFEGNKWNINSKYLVGSLDKEIHSKVLSIIKNRWV